LLLLLALPLLLLPCCLLLQLPCHQALTAIRSQVCTQQPVGAAYDCSELAAAAAAVDAWRAQDSCERLLEGLQGTQQSGDERCKSGISAQAKPSNGTMCHVQMAWHSHATRAACHVLFRAT
jgi:hypothetical protein